MDLEGVTIRRREDMERTGNWLSYAGRSTSRRSA